MNKGKKFFIVGIIMYIISIAFVWCALWKPWLLPAIPTYIMNTTVHSVYLLHVIYCAYIITTILMFVQTIKHGNYLNKKKIYITIGLLVFMPILLYNGPITVDAFMRPEYRSYLLAAIVHRTYFLYVLFTPAIIITALISHKNKA